MIFFSFLSEKPQKWRVEINSGQKKVKTVWQLSDSPPVDHLSFHRPGKWFVVYSCKLFEKINKFTSRGYY